MLAVGLVAEGYLKKLRDLGAVNDSTGPGISSGSGNSSAEPSASVAKGKTQPSAMNSRRGGEQHAPRSENHEKQKVGDSEPSELPGADDAPPHLKHELHLLGTAADHRLAHDVKEWADHFSELYFHTVQPFLNAVFCTRALYRNTQDGGSQVKNMLSYFVISGLVNAFQTPPFGRMLAKFGGLHSEFGEAHSNIVAHAEEIAFLGGEREEKKILNHKLGEVLNYRMTVASAKFRQEVLDGWIFEHCSTIVNMLAVNYPIMVAFQKRVRAVRKEVMGPAPLPRSSSGSSSSSFVTPAPGTRDQRALTAREATPVQQHLIQSRINELRVGFVEHQKTAEHVAHEAGHAVAHLALAYKHVVEFVGHTIRLTDILERCDMDYEVPDAHALALEDGAGALRAKKQNPQLGSSGDNLHLTGGMGRTNSFPARSGGDSSAVPSGRSSGNLPLHAGGRSGQGRYEGVGDSPTATAIDSAHVMGRPMKLRRSGSVSENDGEDKLKVQALPKIPSFSPFVRFSNVSIFTPTWLEEPRVLVRNLDLTVRKGCNVLVKGPNGSGKTSLFRCIAGLWKPRDGSIFLRTSKKRKIGYKKASSKDSLGSIFLLPQTPYLCQGSLYDNIWYPRTPRKPFAAADAETAQLLAAGRLLLEQRGSQDSGSAQEGAPQSTGGQRQSRGAHSFSAGARVPARGSDAGGGAARHPTGFGAVAAAVVADDAQSELSDLQSESGAAESFPNRRRSVAGPFAVDEGGDSEAPSVRGDSPTFGVKVDSQVESQSEAGDSVATPRYPEPGSSGGGSRVAAGTGLAAAFAVDESGRPRYTHGPRRPPPPKTRGNTPSAATSNPHLQQPPLMSAAVPASAKAKTTSAAQRGHSHGGQGQQRHEHERGVLVSPQEYARYRRRIRELLDKVRLAPTHIRSMDVEVEDWSTRLSGGERQKIAFARLLFHNPTFACLDEATSSVSSSSQERLYELVKEAGITFFSIAHRPEIRRFHDCELRLHGDEDALGVVGGGWSFTRIEE